MKTLLIILVALFAISIILAIIDRLSLKKILLPDVKSIKFVQNNLNIYAIVTYDHNFIQEIELNTFTNFQIHQYIENAFESIYVTYLEKR